MLVQMRVHMLSYPRVDAVELDDARLQNQATGTILKIECSLLPTDDRSGPAVGQRAAPCRRMHGARQPVRLQGAVASIEAVKLAQEHT